MGKKGLKRFEKKVQAMARVGAVIVLEVLMRVSFILA